MNVKIVHSFLIIGFMTNIVMANQEDPNFDPNTSWRVKIAACVDHLNQACGNVVDSVAVGLRLKSFRPGKPKSLAYKALNFTNREIDSEALESGLFAGFIASLINEGTLKGNLCEYAKARDVMCSLIQEMTYKGYLSDFGIASNTVPSISKHVIREEIKSILKLDKLSAFRRNPAFRATVFGLPAYLVYQYVSERNKQPLDNNIEVAQNSDPDKKD